MHTHKLTCILVHSQCTFQCPTLIMHLIPLLVFVVVIVATATIILYYYNYYHYCYYYYYSTRIAVDCLHMDILISSMTSSTAYKYAFMRLYVCVCRFVRT